MEKSINDVFRVNTKWELYPEPFSGREHNKQAILKSVLIIDDGVELQFETEGAIEEWFVELPITTNDEGYDALNHWGDGSTIIPKGA